MTTVAQLGRRVEHDPHSKLFPVQADGAVTIESKAWQHFGAVSDQASVPPIPKPNGWSGWGGCVGWTGQDWSNTRPNKISGVSWTNDDGLENYNGSTRNDQWNDNDRPAHSRLADPDLGSSGLGLAKWFAQIGRVGAYHWSFNMDQFLVAVVRDGPVACGFQWTEDMFNPDSKGRIQPTGPVAGGHEFLVIKLEWHNDPSQRGVWILNHWTKAWGINGRAFITLSDFDTLRKQDGDLLTMYAKKAA